jgi:hypothetical protein
VTTGTASHPGNQRNHAAGSTARQPTLPPVATPPHTHAHDDQNDSLIRLAANARIRHPPPQRSVTLEIRFMFADDPVRKA